MPSFRSVAPGGFINASNMPPEFEYDPVCHFCFATGLGWIHFTTSSFICTHCMGDPWEGRARSDGRSRGDYRAASPAAMRALTQMVTGLRSQTSHLLRSSSRGSGETPAPFYAAHDGLTRYRSFSHRSRTEVFSASRSLPAHRRSARSSSVVRGGRRAPGPPVGGAPAIHLPGR
jgi:hypothetical protein